MRKIGSSNLLIGASLVALVAAAAGILLARAHDGGQTADAASAAIPDRPDWNWDVRPILSQNCFSCHGQATQKAGLRLDLQKSAFDPIPEDRSKRAIVPGNPGRSELYKRISSTDAKYRMPPKEAHKTLSARDVAVIERWIAQGAVYKPHWAYMAPTIVKPEKTRWDSQAINEIDRYVHARLAKEGLSPSPETDRETLINRVTLDLTGLPPTLAEVDAFANDKDPNAYEKLVDRLLASAEYAERQTNIWLDVARYADTRGGLNDTERPISYPYRDWVIGAFHGNMRYDAFVTWQLAGDQLANPTREQLLATAFLKAGRQDSEGGSIDEEFRVNYVHERTEMIGKDFLGLTVGCAKCHNHKYDAIAQADYYSLAGFFNQMDERGLSSASRGTPRGTTFPWPTDLQSQKLAEARAVTAAKEATYNDALRAAQQKAAGAVAAVPDDALATFLRRSRPTPKPTIRWTRATPATSRRSTSSPRSWLWAFRSKARRAPSTACRAPR
jgi:cytochrome c553